MELHLQFPKVIFQVGGGSDKDERVAGADYLVDVGRERDTPRIKAHTCQVGGIVLRALEFLDRFRAPYVPCDVGNFLQHDFGNGCGPASTSHDSDTFTYVLVCDGHRLDRIATKKQ